MTTTPITGRALLLSSDDESLDDVEAELVDAGFAVHRCHEPGSDAFPCIGLSGGDCPLDIAGGVDVAIDVRSHPWPSPTAREIGVTCALRASVPVVVVGRHPHPFEAMAMATVEPTGDLLEACDDAITAGLEAARAAVADAVAAVFATHGLGDAVFSVRLERRLGRLQATIAAAVPHDVAAMAATRAAVAIRRFDRAATALEIEVVQPARQR